MPKRKNLAYFRYLQLLQVMDAQVNWPAVDPIEDQILNQIILNQGKEQIQLVGTLICLQEIGSPATLHARIKRLIEKGYLRIVRNPQDGRKKQVELTALAIKRFVRLSSCVEGAALSHS
jgi:hypothetical protein